MSTEEIKQLLEKYYNGESSLDEELLLKEFFKRDDVPDELETEKEIFMYYVKSSGIPSPSEGFEDRIVSAIGDVYQNKLRFRQRRLFQVVTGVAAGLLILAGSYLFFDHRSGRSDTYSDPEIAYNEAIKILYNVSSRMNKGTQALEKVGMMNDAANKSFNVLHGPAAIIGDKMKPLNLLHDTYFLLDNEKKETLTAKQ